MKRYLLVISLLVVFSFVVFFVFVIKQDKKSEYTINGYSIRSDISLTYNNTTPDYAVDYDTWEFDSDSGYSVVLEMRSSIPEVVEVGRTVDSVDYIKMNEVSNTPIGKSCKESGDDLVCNFVQQDLVKLPENDVVNYQKPCIVGTCISDYNPTDGVYKLRDYSTGDWFDYYFTAVGYDYVKIYYIVNGVNDSKEKEEEILTLIVDILEAKK